MQSHAYHTNRTKLYLFHIENKRQPPVTMDAIGYALHTHTHVICMRVDK